MHTEKDQVTLYQMYVFSAIRAIADAPDAKGITLVQTVRGNRYSFPISLEKPFADEIVRALREAEDMQISYLLHVWQDHTLDMPAYGLRQALIGLHPENKDALMMLAGKNGFAILPLGDTM